MTFLINWQIHQDKIHDTLVLFSKMTEDQERSLMGNNVKLIGRWHDLVRGTGVAIFEADSAEAFTAYSLNWNKHMDLDLSLVVDDAGARALGVQLQGGA